MTPQHQIVKIESIKVWVTRLPSLSHPPLSMWRHRVTCLPPKNASAPWGGPGSRWLTIIIWQVSYIQYLLACQKSHRPTPYNIVKDGLPWKRVFRRRHLGRRVTAVTCLRWPTVIMCQAICNHSNDPRLVNINIHFIMHQIQQHVCGTTNRYISSPRDIINVRELQAPYQKL